MNVPYTTGLPEAKSAAVPNRSAFGLREHLITVFRQKRMLLTIIGVATMVAGPGSFLMTNIYSAEVRLLIQNARTPFSMSTPLTGQVFTPSDITQKDDVATEVQIFTSPILLDKLVDYFGNERVLTSMRGRWDWVADLPKFVFKQLAGLPPVAQVLATIGYESKPENLHYQAVQQIRAHLNVEGAANACVCGQSGFARSELFRRCPQRIGGDLHGPPAVHP